MTQEGRCVWCDRSLSFMYVSIRENNTVVNYCLPCDARRQEHLKTCLSCQDKNK